VERLFWDTKFLNTSTMNQNQDKVDLIKGLIKSDKVIKTAIYVAISAISLYALSKTFSLFANVVRGFNDLKSAIKGN
jgi:hypothetical protein